MEKIIKKQQTILISIAIVISAQIHFELFHTDFKISIGIGVFSVALAIFGEYKILPVTFFSATGVLLTRGLLYWLDWGTIDAERFLPEFISYLAYGILFYLYFRKKNYEIKNSSAWMLFVIDLMANLIELLCRSQSYEINWQTIVSFILIAGLRVAMILFVLWCLNYYKFSLLKKEHAERYQKLLMLISRLNAEVVFMQKNRKMIETTMNTSYKLYQEMEKQNIDEELTKKALNIAKDVHELKKEYVLILRGLSEAMELNTKEEGMYLKDIFRVMHHSIKKEMPEGKKVELHFEYEENLYIEQHYFVLSVLRNLINNAIEASDKDIAHINIQQKTFTDKYVLIVQDDGTGIEKENLDQIFLPGFSTKINFETGEVSRGLGLELVKNLVENQWKGEITVQSEPGNTVFNICVPKSVEKGKKE